MLGIRDALMKNLNLDYLQTFVIVVEQGSFSAAAEQLRLTQPGVSLQVRQLEKSLGATLIERVGRKAKPTAAGLELLNHAGLVRAAIDAAVAAVGSRTIGVAGRVRIGTGATACIYLLPSILGELRRKFPSLEITVVTGNTVDIAKALGENTVDIALVTLPLSGRMFEITPIMADEFVLIAPVEMDLPTRITPGVLSAKPIILYESSANTRRIADDWLLRGGVSLKPLMSLGSVEAIKEMVRAGLGCAILPSMALRDRRSQRKLVIRSLFPRLHRRLAVVVRRDKRLDAGLKYTLSALKAINSSEWGDD
jgi:DNA-binding transcriptional LysR family regulator